MSDTDIQNIREKIFNIQGFKCNCFNEQLINLYKNSTDKEKLLILELHLSANHFNNKIHTRK